MKKDNVKPKNDKRCHHCGDYSHFAKTCKTPKHLVALYQKSLKETKPAEEKNMKLISILSLRIKKWVVLGKL
jgi:hypothetical protein